MILTNFNLKRRKIIYIMVYIKLKSDEVKAREKYIANSYNVNKNDKEKNDIVEMISARSVEAYNDLKNQESRKYF